MKNTTSDFAKWLDKQSAYIESVDEDDGNGIAATFSRNGLATPRKMRNRSAKMAATLAQRGVIGEAKLTV